MKLLFLGAGAIGTYVGGSLAAAGHEVAFIERPDVAARLASRGLVVHREGADIAVTQATFFDSPSAALAAGPYDLAVMALKSFDTAGAVDDLLATGAAVPTVLSLQNGVDNERVIAERLGAQRVLTGTVTSAVGKPGLGEAVEEKHRGIGIALGHRLSERVIIAMNQANLSARGYDDAASMKWSKLLTNLTGNATSAILDMSVADLFADPRLYRVEIDVLRECLAVMKAMGLRPIALPGTPVRALAFAAQRLPRFIAQPALSRALGSGRGDKMPSFHIDLHGGRGQSEVDYLNGAVVRYGERYGVATPVNRVLTETLTALTEQRESLESFRRKPEALLERINAAH